MSRHLVPLVVDEVALEQVHVGDLEDLDVGAEDVLEQQVALRLDVDAFDQGESGLHAELAACGGELQAEVGLRAGGADDRRGALALCLGQDELKLAALVAAEREAAQVLALDVEGRSFEPRGQV